MKKGLTGILTAAVILSISTTTVWAAGPGTGCRFVDADGNGICDYAVFAGSFPELSYSFCAAVSVRKRANSFATAFFSL